ncbi:hypothetical protein O0L34_g8278 [Tuta absoluta]|nr:hypothetical protein O0L34_g8278 [Tuta absoluta]
MRKTLAVRQCGTCHENFNLNSNDTTLKYSININYLPYLFSKKNTGHIIAFDCDDDVLNNTLHGVEHGIYFSFSFSFLVARTLLVILSAARVNHTSLAPLMVLYEVQPSKYNAEVLSMIIVLLQ